MQVDERTAAGTSEYQGKTYYFCAPGCKASFDRDPEKYVQARPGDAQGGHGEGHGEHGGHG
jgi:YHS domain-containing protein